MQLRFLGAEYNCQWPSVETRDGEVTGKYRGVAWSSKHHSATVAATTPVTLRFMGRSYQAQV
ncbi:MULTISPECIES: DUF4278 domain-containing protein [Cyanophyceae]|uniref:DUF4278 domain-containing protein n=1 Tax=Cyanophyceae TaxID=3028117 RepID=UPI00168988ED|nr:MULTISPECIES: DUF4278 domain-containing protein [Cyanophyceae]MBD1918532.1 DUF4278 domain-containing protein [Phormidium sp. FACHB-77]MBD2031421.1 DUF4278 domain-containing protein [Phormidium sp. FACHB-322]MBD2049540.1 DUF4278 domain-containing protein [Leptolyngbya sp. FACHB-60]